MKRALILLIVLLMALEGLALAEPAQVPAPADPAGETDAADRVRIAYDYNSLTVGTATPFQGSFFSEMWGNVTSDLDVRMLVHGYNLVKWRGEDGVFAVNDAVVSGILVTQNAAGDRTYTLSLYDDLFYSDGTQIGAADYVFSMLLAIAPQITEIGGSVKAADHLAGYERYVSGESRGLSGVRLIDADTLSVTVRHEYLPYFYEMALLDCTPCPIQVIAPGCRVADDGAGAYIANIDETVEEPLFTAELLRGTLLDEETGYLSHPSVTCGPYRLTAYDGRTAAFERNEYYKGDADGRLPSIQHLYYTTVAYEDAVDRLARGELGLLNKVVPADVLREGMRLVAEDDGFAMDNYTRNGLSFIGFCCEREPVDRAAVRRAVAMCLDKDAMTADAVGNYGLRVDGYYGLGQWMYQLVDGSQPYPVKAPAPDAGQAELDAYEAEIAKWEALSLDGAEVYEFDTAAAARLLAEEGWRLNREGEAFRPGVDDVRCREIDGEIRPLELKLACPEGSSLNAHIPKHFADHLAEAGVGLTVETLPMPELLDLYYRRRERDCDMILLATNFDVVFDPSISFMPDDRMAPDPDGPAAGEPLPAEDGDPAAEGEVRINPRNPTAIADAELYRRAVAMRRTESDDPLNYCRNWIAFQERFQELEPIIPIYSNVYFDFYPRALHGYDITGSITWSQAIVGAYLSDVSDDEREAAGGGFAPGGEEIEILGD